MYINFNTLVKAGFFNALFLPRWPFPSARLTPWEKEILKQCCSIAAWRLDSYWVVAAWCGHAAPVCWIHQSVQSNNPERVAVCGHSSSLFCQSVQGPKLGKGLLTDLQGTPFTKSGLSPCLQWIPFFSPPACRSRNWRDASHCEAALRRPFAWAAVLSDERVNERPDLQWVLQMHLDAQQHRLVFGKFPSES